MQAVAIVVAAGRGTRIGFRKQYALLGGKPVWARSCDALIAAGVERIWLVVPEEDLAGLAEAPAVRMYGRCLALVGGGASRFASVRNGVLACAEAMMHDHHACLADILVAVHDAARPFVAVKDVERVLAAAAESGAAMLGQPCADTVKRVEANVVRETVPREQLWLAQTPQVFRLDWMYQLYPEVVDESSVTDDACLFERAGFAVRMVAATEPNFKITAIGDWALAEWLAEQRWGGGRASADRVGL
ncbi:MAG: 2-C-methyl-D-erythritol 4-phosphate cytidylyltransferase [Alicyclobacillus sp.]|nr:2-C-methyl-D-erythritol 4-phosphate cytidylyltransferase [Alicyclobacillus sp.]